MTEATAKKKVLPDTSLCTLGSRKRGAREKPISLQTNNAQLLPTIGRRSVFWNKVETRETPHLQEKLFKVGNHSGIRVRVREKPVVPDTGLTLRKCVCYKALG